MRKFRAKATQDYQTNTDGVENGDWVYGYYYFCRERMSGIIVTDLQMESGGVGSGIVQVEIKVDEETVGQYTGLKAKGKEIYEGDIVKVTSISVEDYVGEVIFKDGCFWIVGEKDSHQLFVPLRLEIIGNIHENPKLT